MNRRGLARSAALVGAAAAFLAAAALPAAAHNYVVGTDPGDGETVDAVQDVSVTFNDVLLDMGGESTVVDVLGPDGSHYATGCPEISDSVVSAPVELGGAGEYTVAWRVVSADGHPISGDYTFDYEPSDDASPAAGADEPACAGVSGDDGGTSGDPSASGAAGDAAEDDAPSTDATQGASTPVLVGLAVGVAVVAGVGVLVALRVGRRRSGDGPA